MKIVLISVYRAFNLRLISQEYVCIACFDCIECSTCNYSCQALLSDSPASSLLSPYCRCLAFSQCSFMWLSKHSFWRINRNVSMLGTCSCVCMCVCVCVCLCARRPSSNPFAVFLPFILLVVAQIFQLTLALSVFAT